MPMSIEELEQHYRRAYRRLSVVIALVYGMLLLGGLAAVVGNTGFAGWLPGTVQLSEPAAPLQPVKRIHTVTNE